MLSDVTIRRDPPESIFLKYLYKARKAVSLRNRRQMNERIKQKLENTSFSLICNNCLGGVFLHDAGRQFTSPTVNLAFDGEEFIRFVENLEHYLYSDFVFKEQNYVQYPVADLDDIEVRFVHYRDNEECVRTWRKRTERIDWTHIFVIATDADGLNTPDLFERFDKLPYRKVLFTAQSLPQYEWAVTVPQFRGRFQVRIMTQMANFKGERYYETCFDIAKWIRENCQK